MFKPRIPRLDNYHTDTVIQYQPEDRHFRVVKTLGASKTLILDAGSTIELSNF